MSEKATTASPQAVEKDAAKWWCNFCNFKTNDQKAYLAHSCTEFLKQQGKTIEATGKNSCG